MSIIEDLFNIFAPHECLTCHREGGLLCASCLAQLTRTPSRCYGCKRWVEGFRTCQRCRRHSPLSQVWSFAPYEGAAKDVVYALKFARAKAGASVIAHALAAVYDGSDTDEVVISYIPTVNQRVRERGYDQAALIAKAFCRELGLPYHTLLARLGDQRQVGQKREIRKQQMQNAFRPLSPPVFQNKHVLLIDDVLTTGATCEAAARVLRHAGAKQVSAAVFAVA